MTDQELGWVAGLLEGEGCFILRRGRFPRGEIGCYSTDRDVLERLQAVTGLGRIYENKSRQPGWKPYFHWRVERKAEVHRFALLVLPLMSTRRSEAIRTMLAGSTADDQRGTDLWRRRISEGQKRAWERRRAAA